MTQKNYDIIAVSHFFYPRVGGLELAAYNLLKDLTKADYNCLTLHGDNKTDSWSADGFDWMAVRPILTLFDGTYPIFGPKYFYNFWKLLRENPNTKIFIYSRHLQSSLLTAMICKILSRPYTLIEQTADTSYFNSKVLSWLGSQIDRYIFGLVVKFAHRVVAVSQASRDFLRQTYAVPSRKITVIHNGYDPKSLVEYRDKTPKENLAVFAAKWMVVKDPQTVLDAFTKLAPQHPTWEFVFAGEGSGVSYKLETIPANLNVIPHFLSQDELLRLLAKSKLYVNASLSEGLSLTLAEAAALGNLPIISDAPSNLEVADKLETQSFVFPRQSVGGLMKTLNQRIATITENPGLHSKISQRAKAFSNQKLSQKYQKLLFDETQEKPQSISFVVPAYNEEETISRVLTRLHNLRFAGLKKEIIIVDDGSTDNTRVQITQFVDQKNSEKSTATVFKVLSNSRNLGKSQSVRKGILHSGGDLVVVQDADLEYDPRDLEKFVAEFRKDPELDVIYGNRFLKTNKFLSFIHEWGNRAVTFLSNLLTTRHGLVLYDMEVCYKMMRGNLAREIVPTLSAQSNFGIEPELTAKLAKYRKNSGFRLRVVQLPVSYNARSKSDGKKLHTVKDGLRSIGEILLFNFPRLSLPKLMKTGTSLPARPAVEITTK